MKPLFLSIQAFGAFHEKQVIDFQQFSSLFLIHGPTGAGKTTIFDAMCYALYGETTGGRKNMRSDYAPEKTETEVEFVFSVGLQAYKMVRKLKVTGKIEKTITEKQTYEQGVWLKNIFTADEQPLTKKTDIKDKIEQVLGFTEAQFKQIIVLPQGNFQEFLRSKNNEKTEVLQKLFNADIYRQIREKLEEKAKDAQKKHDELDNKIQTILHANKFQTSADIETKIMEYETDIANLEAQLPIQEKQYRKSQKTIAEAQALDKVFIEFAQAETALLKHTQQQSIFDTLQEKLKNNENAEPFKANIAQQKDAEKQRDSYEKNILNQQAILMRTEKKITEISQILKENQEIWEDTIEKNKFKINDLEKIKPKFEEIAKKEKELSTETNKLDSTKKEIAKLKNQLEKSTSQEMDLKNKNYDLEIIKQKKGDFEQIFLQIKEKQQTYKQLLTAREAYKNIQQVLKNAVEAGVDAGEKAQNNRQNYDETDAKWRNSQAFTLAEKLQEGEACLVCGSTHHPKKATANTNIVTEEQLKKARTAYDLAEKKYREAGILAKDKESERQQLVYSGELLKKQLGDLATLTEKQFAERVGEAQNNFDQAQKATQEVANITKQLATIAQETNNTLEQIKTNEGKENELKTIVAVQESLIRAIITDIPKEINSLDKLQELLTKYATEKEKIQDLLNKYTEELKTENENANKAKNTIYEDQKHLVGNRLEKKTGIQDIIRDLEKNIQKDLAKYGFADIKAVNQALLSENDKKIAKQKTEGFNDEKKKLQAVFEDRREKIDNQIKPDLISLQNEANSLEASYMESNRKLTQVKTEKDKIIIQKTEIHRQQTDLLEWNEKHDGLSELANIAGGRNDLRQKFEVFVLSVFLDEVIYFANQRLDLLSSGRYQLERSDEVADGRKGGGMDLLVADQYTGTTRPVENLSGGETFFTSLALALGLADTAVAQAGGRSLDAIFIDEGFGTLDSETLDLAIKTLHNLSDEQRLVGIVSHVAELKERIPSKLEVKKQKNGSVVKIQV